MEKGLDEVLEALLNSNEVSGCIVSDKQGLCLECKGVANPASSGLITAVADIVKKLHPNESEPAIILEGNEKQCMIKSNDKLVVSVYRNLST